MVQQGSPLLPLLYVLAAQPLASHLRRQAQPHGHAKLDAHTLQLWPGCQTIMEWQSQCHLPMHLPAAQGFGQRFLPIFPILPSKPS